MGGQGLIGRALTALMTARGHDVVSLDIKTGTDLREPFSAPDCDRVWFLAWDVGGAKYLEAAESQHQIFRNNSLLCLRVFDYLASTKRPFMFATSQLAGQPHGYGMTKAMAETWSRQLGGRRARLWNVYGWEAPSMRSHVVTDLVLGGLRSGVVQLRTDGCERRRLLYQTDCAEALLALFDGPEMEADICGPTWHTMMEVAERIGRLLGVPAEAGSSSGSEVIIDPRHPVSGWRPRISLDEGLALVIAEAKRALSEGTLDA